MPALAEVVAADGHVIKEAERVAGAKWRAIPQVPREQFKDVSDSTKSPSFITEFFGGFPIIYDIIQIVRLAKSGIREIKDIINTQTSSDRPL